MERWHRKLTTIVGGISEGKLMRKINAFLVGLLATLSIGAPVWSGPIPSPLQGVAISAKVSKRNDIFTFGYRVFNPHSNDGHILNLDIDITRGPSDAILSREGLTNGRGYLRHTSEATFQRVPMVPVGILGPPDWTLGLGFHSKNDVRGYASWGGIEDSSLILPGQSLEGFQLTSYGLPGIRTVEVHPDIDWQNVPDEFSDSAKARQLRDSLIFSTKTVGPTAPPADFVPKEFLNYLISLLHDSRDLGWVKEDKAQEKLLKQLLKAKRDLEKDKTANAVKELKKFVEEVEDSSCREFHCRDRRKALTSEAYALLYFNGQYLIEQLPEAGRKRRDDDHHRRGSRDGHDKRGDREHRDSEHNER